MINQNVSQETKAMSAVYTGQALTFLADKTPKEIICLKEAELNYRTSKK